MPAKKINTTEGIKTEDGSIIKESVKSEFDLKREIEVDKMKAKGEETMTVQIEPQFATVFGSPAKFSFNGVRYEFKIGVPTEVPAYVGQFINKRKLGAVTSRRTPIPKPEEMII